MRLNFQMRMKFNFLLLLLSGFYLFSCDIPKENLDSISSFKEINLSVIDESLTKEIPDFTILINDSVIASFEKSRTQQKQWRKTIQLPKGKCTLKIQTYGDSIVLLDSLTISSQKELLWVYYNEKPTKLQFVKFFAYKKCIKQLSALGIIRKTEFESLNQNLMLSGEINDSIINSNKYLFETVKNEIENEEGLTEIFSNRKSGFSILYHQRMTL